MARYRIGNDITVVWTVNDRNGEAFPLTDKDVHLYYTCERGRYEAEIQIQDTNKIVWEFYGGLQKILGGYSLTLEILQSDGMRSIKKDICNAFTFVGKDCEADMEAVSTNGDVAVHQEIITTNLDICRVSPIVPTIEKDESGVGYWFVDGINTGERATGESAYEYAQQKGFEGTEEEFAAFMAERPDWNAVSPNEGGFILNRTHGIAGRFLSVKGTLTDLAGGVSFADYVTVMNYDDTLMDRVLCLNGNFERPSLENEFSLKNYPVPNGVRIIEDGAGGYEIQVKAVVETGIVVEISVVDINLLSEVFLPDSILRKYNVATINGKSLVEGGNIEIEVGGGSVPDWNAKSNEAGYIANRTHYVETSIKAEIDITNAKIGDSFIIPAPISNLQIWGSNPVNSVKVVPNTSILIPAQGPNVYATFTVYSNTETQMVLDSSPHGVPNIIKIGTITYRTLKDDFLPATIARTDWVTQQILNEHAYILYDEEDNVVYFKGLTISDWMPMQTWHCNLIVGKPITTHMIIFSKGNEIVLSTNKFEVFGAGIEPPYMTWIFDGLKYTLRFTDTIPNEQIITTEPYVEGGGAVLYTEQSLTEEQKSQARTNIGVDDAIEEAISSAITNVLNEEV